MLRRRLPGCFMAFLADAHRRGILRQEGAVYQFRHIELQHRLANTSGKIGSYYDVQYVGGDKYRVILAEVIDPAQCPDQDTIPDNGERFVGAIFAITAPGGNAQGENANRCAAAIGNDRQIYLAKTNGIAGYTNFDTGFIHVGQGETVTRFVIFQVPDEIEVLKIHGRPAGPALPSSGTFKAS